MTDRIDQATRQDVYARIDRRFDDFVEELRAYARVPTNSAPGKPRPRAPRPPGRSSSATASRPG